ncbi:5-formyltetrahydrofolate cyclo-ligase [Peptostreptococcus faecalis]|uniref:5-formyltetrahydrofolate cyclo-ligase n=1 Tax=Peptostreptococcus faecalis TaxID=2045015 RepID=UPI000C7CF1D0|nr:5-formyltetrahydrofolate cyclo-ligase [Peptostreptococcus faecalis]
MNKIKKNFQKELEKIIDINREIGKIPKLLLHSCCGPCSSYCLEYLSNYFEITVFYYNPNIYPSDEYWYRVEEQQKIIELTDAKNLIRMIEGKYETDKFYKMAKGLEHEPEGGKRCIKCYEMRLKEAAKIAKEFDFDYFTTTLTISPHKNSQKLNEIGELVGEIVGVNHLPSDFKKNNGYKRSCEIAKNYGLYRQDYCGCVFSKRESEIREIKQEKKKIRESMNDLNKSLNKNYMISAEDIIIEKLCSSEEYKNASTIFSYVGVYPEIDTSKFITRALEEGKRICVPYCIDKETMLTYEINSIDDLRPGKFDIPEPDPEKLEEVKREEVDLIIVPCCTVDLQGNRLGFGRGYYDRYLEVSNAEKVILIRKKQMIDKVPVESHDIKIEKIIFE